NQTVTWSVANGTGQATISSSGLVTAVANGTVTARATANDGSGVYGTLTITISSQVIPVTAIAVTGAGGANTIATDNGTLQLNAAITPSNATNQTVTWSISNGTGQATISSSGLVTAVANGTVTARATANDGSGVYGTLTITISNQIIPVTGITVTGPGGATTIYTDNGTLQLSAVVLPVDATNKTVTWSISSGLDKASISHSGLVTALDNGTAVARATANDGSGVFGIMDIVIDVNIADTFVVVVNLNEIEIQISEKYFGSRVSIYDLSGNLRCFKMADSNLCTFDVSNFHPGLFLVVLSNKRVLKVAKVIID
ncbi:MAG: Ig-like domain-containing protein, partial [Bacteroidales bacterium]